MRKRKKRLLLRESTREAGAPSARERKKEKKKKRRRMRAIVIVIAVEAPQKENQEIKEIMEGKEKTRVLVKAAIAQAADLPAVGLQILDHLQVLDRVQDLKPLFFLQF